jgi:hypothetical protein
LPALCLPLPSPGEMEMEVKYHLPGTSFHVEDELVAGAIDTDLLRNISSSHDERGDYILIVVRKIINAPDMFPGNQEQVDWSMGVDILENHQQIILVDDICMTFP